MTERLSTLLQDEAAALSVPAPDPARVLATGRRLRLRRRVTTGVASVAVVAVIAGGAAVASSMAGGGGPDKDAVDPAGPSTGHGAVFTLGTTVFYDGGTAHVQIDDKAIKSSYYTSAGLLVRHGDNNASDGGGPQRFSLVTEDGTVQPVSVVTEEVVPGVDPAQPYLAYAEVVGGVVQVVVHDVSTDEEMARVPVPDAEQWGGWSAPPVALSGDTVYVGTDDVMRTVDWRTGEVGTTDVVAPGYPDIEGGRAVRVTGDASQVIDVETGKVLLEIPANEYLNVPTLSPDGRFAVWNPMAGSGVMFIDIAADTHVSLHGQPFDYGWTPDGDVFQVKRHHVITCSTSTGACETGETVIPDEGGGVEPTDLRYANQTFES